MKIYLAGTQGNIGSIMKHYQDEKLYFLESYHYLNDKKMQYYTNHHFLLDSGAFTFMVNAKVIDWDSYIEEYANFIKRNNIELFFELDIDSIVGIEEVERLRAKLEHITQRKCIPVWHKSRGKEYWLKMVKEYDYVAIGGIVTKEITRKEYPIFSWLLHEARKENCKVHGLGFTNLKGIQQYKFYSVDSTSWLMGQKFGRMQTYLGGVKFKNVTRSDMGENHVMINPSKRLEHNFHEWVKFQQYADIYL